MLYAEILDKLVNYLVDEGIFLHECMEIGGMEGEDLAEQLKFKRAEDPLPTLIGEEN